MVHHSDDTTTSPEEDTEYADIYIPVPYDPEIPGVRCVDAEEVENVDVAMLTSLSDEGGEDIELQDLGQGDDLGDDGGEDIELQDLGQGDDLNDAGALDPLLSVEEEPPAEDKLQTGDIEDVV